MRDCPECFGKGTLQEPCRDCKGIGFLRKKRLFRKQVKLLDCTNPKCFWGAISETCPSCKGKGWVD